MKKNKKTLRNLVFISCCLVLFIEYGCKTIPKKQNSTKSRGQAEDLQSAKLRTLNNEAYAGELQEDSKEVFIRTEGRAQILEGGEQNAYDKALEHGLRQAVEQVIGVQLVAETSVLDSRLLEDRILTKSLGYVKRYQVTKSSKKGDVLSLNLEAWVLVSELKNDIISLQLFQRRINLPRLAVFIKAKSEDIAQSATAALEKELLSKQFLLVEQTDIQSFLSKLTSPLQAQSDETINTFIEQTDAEFYVEGRLEVAENDISKNETLSQSGFVSYSGFLSIKAFDAGTGRVFLSFSETAAAVGLSAEIAGLLAAKKTAEKTAAIFSKKLLAYFDDKLNNGFEYEIRFSGLNDDERRRLKSRFNERYFEGLKAIADRGYQDGLQTFTVYYAGSLSQLIDSLVSGAKFPFKLRLKEYQETRAWITR